MLFGRTDSFVDLKRMLGVCGRGAFGPSGPSHKTARRRRKGLGLPTTWSNCGRCGSDLGGDIPGFARNSPISLAEKCRRRSTFAQMRPHWPRAFVPRISGFSRPGPSQYQIRQGTKFFCPDDQRIFRKRAAASRAAGGLFPVVSRNRGFYTASTPGRGPADPSGGVQAALCGNSTNSAAAWTIGSASAPARIWVMKSRRI